MNNPAAFAESRPRKSVQRFCDDDMRKIKDLKREKRI
jgi:hypothetical protein